MNIDTLNAYCGPVLVTGPPLCQGRLSNIHPGTSPSPALFPRSAGLFPESREHRDAKVRSAGFDSPLNPRDLSSRVGGTLVETANRARGCETETERSRLFRCPSGNN